MSPGGIRHGLRGGRGGDGSGSDIAGLYFATSVLSCRCFFHDFTRGWVVVTNVCLRVPFYGGHYVCYSFFSAAHDRRGATCVHTLYHRLASQRTCLRNRRVRAVCLNNNAPSRLTGRSFRTVFSRVCGMCGMVPSTRVALRTGPSSLAPRCVSVLHAFPFGQVDVKVRAFRSSALGLLRHHRATRRTVHTFRGYHATNFQGVDVSLVCKLPKRALTS